MVQYLLLQVIINGWNCGFGEKTATFSNKRHDCSILQLALEFFEFYAEYDSTDWIICPLIGELVSRESIGRKAGLPNDLDDYVRAPSKLQHETELVVQDPFDLGHNVTRGLKAMPFDRFQVICKESVGIMKDIIALKAPLAALFRPIDLNDNMEPVSKNEIPCVDLDESTEVEIIAEINGIFDRHKEKKAEFEEKRALIEEKFNNRMSISERGTKRTSSEVLLSGNGITSEEIQFCTNFKAECPTVYKMTLNVNLPFQFDNKTTGDLKYCETETEHNVESIRTLGLDMLTFIFESIYATQVTRTEVTIEAATKKQKNGEDSATKMCHCIAKYELNCPYDLRDGKPILKKINASIESDEVSPFAYERKITQLQLNDIKTGQTKYGKTIAPSVDLRFFVCHDPEKLGEMFVVADTRDLTTQQKSFLLSLCIALRLLGNTCIRKANIHVERLKQKLEKKLKKQAAQQ